MRAMPQTTRCCVNRIQETQVSAHLRLQMANKGPPVRPSLAII